MTIIQILARSGECFETTMTALQCETHCEMVYEFLHQLQKNKMLEVTWPDGTRVQCVRSLKNDDSPFRLKLKGHKRLDFVEVLGDCEK